MIWIGRGIDEYIYLPGIRQCSRRILNFTFHRHFRASNINHMNRVLPLEAGENAISASTFLLMCKTFNTP